MRIYPIIFMVLLAVISHSCIQDAPTDQQKISKAIYDHLQTRIDDPDSFEFVQISDIDTITEKEFYEREVKVFSVKLENKDQKIREVNELRKQAQKLLQLDKDNRTAKESMIYSAIELLRIERDQNKVDSLQSLADTASDDIRFIEANYHCRMNNKEGNKNLYKYYVQLNKDLAVNSMVEMKQ